MKSLRLLFGLALLARATAAVSAQPFLFPTINHALLEPGGEERFFVGTAGKPYTTGRFGCVRTDGHQMHEGLDIKCVQRTRGGEPMDRVSASADGTVVYANSRPGLSNYGKYIVLRHHLDGLEVYTLYAHLSEIENVVKAGALVKAGQAIGVMGHTSNTHQAITKDRAHVHFEIDLLASERFPAWFKSNFPDQRNDHGVWNGLNLLGLDPRRILLAQASEGAHFNLLHLVRDQAELCRVLVRSSNFPWLHRYMSLVRRNPIAEKEGAAAYELSLNYNGVPFQLVPRAPSEVRPGPKYQLLSVNEAEEQDHPCRKLVNHARGHWELAPAGIHLLELLTY